MAILKQPSITFLLLALVTFSFTTTSSNAADCVGAGAISVYWGQNSESTEGSLRNLCSSQNYNIVILESLLVFDNDTIPTINLSDHCGTMDNPCSRLQPEIEYCQQNNITVLLSITLKSKTRYPDSYSPLAENLAIYLRDNFLNGQAGPLGNVSLDGIDIADVEDGVNLQWSEVVRAINASITTRKIYLSASPQCVYPDFYLGAAIDTGLFDYIWVEFFSQNPSCIYSNGNATNLLSAWSEWTSNVPNSSIFLGLVPSDQIAGYIAPEALISEVLPTAKRASNYGGVMIRDRYYDNYSAQIIDRVPKVCTCVCDVCIHGLRSASCKYLSISSWIDHA